MQNITSALQASQSSATSRKSHTLKLNDFTQRLDVAEARFHFLKKQLDLTMSLYHDHQGGDDSLLDKKEKEKTDCSAEKKESETDVIEKEKVSENGELAHEKENENKDEKIENIKECQDPNTPSVKKSSQNLENSQDIDPNNETNKNLKPACETAPKEISAEVADSSPNENQKVIPIHINTNSTSSTNCFTDLSNDYTLTRYECHHTNSANSNWENPNAISTIENFLGDVIGGVNNKSYNNNNNNFILKNDRKTNVDELYHARHLFNKHNNNFWKEKKSNKPQKQKNGGHKCKEVDDNKNKPETNEDLGKSMNEEIFYSIHDDKQQNFNEINFYNSKDDLRYDKYFSKQQKAAEKQKPVKKRNTLKHNNKQTTQNYKKILKNTENTSVKNKISDKMNNSKSNKLEKDKTSKLFSDDVSIKSRQKKKTLKVKSKKTRLEGIQKIAIKKSKKSPFLKISCPSWENDNVVELYHNMTINNNNNHSLQQFQMTMRNHNQLNNFQQVDKVNGSFRNDMDSNMLRYLQSNYITGKKKFPSISMNHCNKSSKFTFNSIPFVACKSTTPSHNIGLNIQQVHSVVKMHHSVLGMPPSTVANSLITEKNMTKTGKQPNKWTQLNGTQPASNPSFYIPGDCKENVLYRTINATGRIGFQDNDTELQFINNVSEADDYFVPQQNEVIQDKNYFSKYTPFQNVNKPPDVKQDECNNQNFLSRNLDDLPNKDLTNENETFDHLEEIEKKLEVKEAEISSVMTLYKEVLSLKEQVQSLKNRASRGRQPETNEQLSPGKRKYSKFPRMQPNGTS